MLSQGFNKHNTVCQIPDEDTCREKEGGLGDGDTQRENSKSVTKLSFLQHLAAKVDDRVT